MKRKRKGGRGKYMKKNGDRKEQKIGISEEKMKV